MKILMLESTHFESAYRVGCHHYAEALARRGHEVLFVSHYVSPFHLLGPGRDDARLRLDQHRRGPIRRADRLHSYVPFTLFPVHGKRAPRLLGRLCLRDALPAFARLLSGRGFRRVDAVLLSHLQLANLLEVFRTPGYGRGRLVARSTDDASRFPSLPGWFGELEAKSARAADAVVCTSSRMAQRFRALGARDVRHLPNGVDLARFHPAPASPDGPPRIVYVGALEAWFDAPLLSALARRFPEMRFTVAGPARTDLSALRGLPNVDLTGPVPYAEVPALLAAHHVGIIPFLRTPLVESVSPIKMYEYAASGLPVVATRWEELERAGSPALLAEGVEEFAAALAEALARRAELSEAGVRFAAACGWDERAAGLERALAGERG